MLRQQLKELQEFIIHETHELRLATLQSKGTSSQDHAGVLIALFFVRTVMYKSLRGDTVFY